MPKRISPKPSAPAPQPTTEPVAARPEHAAAAAAQTPPLPPQAPDAQTPPTTAKLQAPAEAKAMTESNAISPPLLLTVDDRRDEPYAIHKDQTIIIELERSHANSVGWIVETPMVLFDKQPKIEELPSPTARPLPEGQFYKSGSRVQRERLVWTPEMTAKCGPNFTIGLRLKTHNLLSDLAVFRFTTRK